MICKNCGSQIDDKAVICVHCKKEIKKPFYKKPWFWILAVIAALVVFVALFGESSPTEPEATVPSTSPQIDVIEITAEDLYLAYDQNSVGAEKKYDGKMLKISGDVRSIGTDIINKTYVTLDVGEVLASIQCYFKGDAINGIIDLLEGDHITLIGRCDGMSLTNVMIDDCEIVSVSSVQTPSDETQPTEDADSSDFIEIDASELYAQYDKNSVAADAKFKDKKIKVTGTVHDMGTDILDKVYVSLDTGEYFYTIQCYFKNKTEEDKVAQLVKGQQITIIGTCEGMTLNVTMKRCEIVE